MKHKHFLGIVFLFFITIIILIGCSSVQPQQTEGTGSSLEQNIQNGKKIYDRHCRSCHGADGMGGVGSQLQPNSFVQESSPGELTELILKGRSGTAMTGFDSRLTENEISDLIAFLHTWQP